jgi:hypothetical protein
MEGPTDTIFDNMLDGNTAAGVLQELFGVEMTATPTECDNCGPRGRARNAADIRAGTRGRAPLSGLLARYAPRCRNTDAYHP